MRILLAAHGFPPDVVGGTERYVERLARSLAGRGHEVVVFAGSLEHRPRLEVEDSSSGGVRALRVHRDDLYFDRWDKGHHPGVSGLFERTLREVEPDIVHVHHWIRLTTDLAYLANARGAVVAITLHDLFPSCPRVFRLKDEMGEVACEEPMGTDVCLECVPRWRFDRDEDVASAIETYAADMRRELLSARVRIAPTAGHGAFLCRMLGLDDEEIRVLPHGTLSEPIATAPRPASGGEIHVACWSHLHPLKGQHLLLEAARRAKHRDRLRIHLLGEAVDEAYRERLRSLAEGLRVEFHGRFVPADLARLPVDAAVLPTLCRESYSFILDEAARLGVPILASDAGALAERATGRVLLFARNDPDSLAARLDQVAGDSALRARMGGEPPPELLQFEEHVERLLALYEEARAAGPRPVLEAPDRALQHFSRREAYFRELVRTERWEDVVRELRQRIADLEERLRGR